MPYPFEPQKNEGADRRCGAACLRMVYRSFGFDASQEEIWTAIASVGSGKRRAARTHRLAVDAISRGLDAVVLRVRDPESWLPIAATWRLGVVLNHRPRLESRYGHFSVLVGADTDGVTLHDPERGPNLSLALDEFLSLWRPIESAAQAHRQVTGRIAVVLGPRDDRAAPCEVCGRVSSIEKACRECGFSLRSRPFEALGCLDGACPGRRWDAIFCPRCDARVDEYVSS